MADSSTPPDVEAIIAELRQGLDDSAVHAPQTLRDAAHRQLRSSLRKASETADVLGRCGGSMRGKLCKLLAVLAWPVVEQLNLHHSAVVGALSHIRETNRDNAPAEQPPEPWLAIEKRLQALEAEVEALRAEPRS